jgi:hemerythrin-like domain-containing protein
MTHAALKIIHEEHRALAAMLESLRLIGERFGKGSRSAEDIHLMRAILFYIDEFPERMHHVKETEVLFPRLRERAPEAVHVLDHLDAQHERGEDSIRELEHLLLAYEQLGEPRLQDFLDALRRYVTFYTEHMELEEAEMLPLAERKLSEDDWQAVNLAFAENRDPLTGHKPSDEYVELFDRIVAEAPAPIGLGRPR